MGFWMNILWNFIIILNETNKEIINGIMYFQLHKPSSDSIDIRNGDNTNDKIMNMNIYFYISWLKLQILPS